MKNQDGLSEGIAWQEMDENIWVINDDYQGHLLMIGYKLFAGQKTPDKIFE